MTIAIPPVEGNSELVRQLMPSATIREVHTVGNAMGDESVTGMLMPLERAFYWSRVTPELSAVRPAELRLASVTVYALPPGELEFRNLVDLWIETRRASGEADAAYAYWVRGEALTPHVPRWSILRNVIGWRH